jgi:hypothetical protein
MQTDTLTWWEKASAGALFVASGLYAAEWYIGARMPPQIAAALPWIVSVGGLVTLFAIDGALVSTVMGARAGRRSRWTWITIGVSALFGALVALVLHGALPAWVGSWLHAGFMATIAAYLMHLSQPRTASTAHVDSLSSELAETRAALDAALTQLDALRTPVLTEVETPVKQLTSPVDARPDIVRWKDDDGLTFDAIGVRLSISKQAAQARYRRAKGE